MRGYFGIGVEGLSKAMNAGSLFRTAHAFGASFVFTIAASYSTRQGGKADTSDAHRHVPLHDFETVQDLRLPRGCALVGVELAEDAIELPSFRHPQQAAYVLGAERDSLSPGLQSLCDHVVRIPTAFAINVALAGALVMYDRLVSSGRFAARPVHPSGAIETLPPPEFGEPLWKKKARRRAREQGR